MSMITGDWQEALSDEFRKDYYKKLYTFVKEEYNSCVVYPPADDIFNAFHFTPLKSVKVLILGQDPYHEVNQAHGLSFSVLPGNPFRHSHGSHPPPTVSPAPVSPVRHPHQSESLLCPLYTLYP